jgi:hypothetical protein
MLIGVAAVTPDAERMYFGRIVTVYGVLPLR